MAPIWRHYRRRIGLLTLLQPDRHAGHPGQPGLLQPQRLTQLGTGASTGHKLLLAFALFASVLAAGMLWALPATGAQDARPHSPPAVVPARQGE